VAVRTVLRNLVDNAIKAVAAKGGGVVRVEGRRAAGAVELEVRDDGVGFPPEEADRLFEKFYRLGDELRRTSPGSGLGLYIVRRFVQLTGGRVSARSAGPGEGAAFTVRWPAARGEDA
jgi:signal transduction histidine kinase